MSIGVLTRSALLLASGVLVMSAQRYDLVLHGGHVLDPANGIDAVTDVAVIGTKIAAVQANIPASEAKKFVDASGLYVVPGLIDLHAHVFGYEGAIFPDDTALPAGTTTVVDAGGSGWRTFDEFRGAVITKSKTRVLALINIVGKGMVGSAAESNTEDMDPERTAAAIKANRDFIVGIKTAHFGGTGWTAIDRAVAAGRLAEVPVMVDDRIQTNTGRTTREKLLDHLRPGDIHTHMYNDRQIELIDRFSGKVQPYMLEARRRGVLFDLGHGSGSFLWPVASRAMAAGFMPDTISTDLHSSSIMGPQSDMPNCISKLMYLGMSLPDAVRRSTVSPAKEIGRFPEIGTMGVGRTADIAVLREENGVFALKDAWGVKRLAPKRIRAVMTIRDGKLVYDRTALVSHASPQEIYDLLLKNGNVIDPANHRSGRFDIAIAGKKIVHVGRDIPAAHARAVVDVSSYYVTPGLIDLNTHFDGSLNPDHNCLRNGVTTAVNDGKVDTKHVKVQLLTTPVSAVPADVISSGIDKESALLARANMMTAMSRFLGRGLSVEQVIERASVNPARAIQRPDLGTLKDGSQADVAVLTVDGDRQLRCVMTVRNGSVVWDSEGLAAPDVTTMGPYTNFK
jgi:dihydroorotase